MMDGSMNFLHKKYTSSFNHSLSHSRSSRSFLPPQSAASKDAPISHQNASPSSIAQQTLMTNHCPAHPQELLRHMCLDCIELLCSECIGQHIGQHKQTQTFPTIQTLKQVRQDVSQKLTGMTEYMMKQNHHPKSIDVEDVRREENQKVDRLRRETIAIVDQWIVKIRNSLVNNDAFDEIIEIKKQMRSLQEEVNSLNNSLSGTNASAQAVKKAYKIDAEKLYNSYKGMVEKYQGLRESLNVEIQIDREKLLNSLQECLLFKGTSVNPHKIEEKQQQKIDYPLQISHPNPYHQEKPKEDEQCLGLYELQSGSNILVHIPIGDPLTAYTFNLQSTNKPSLLSSSLLLPNDVIIVSGGMISQAEKSSQVELYELPTGKVITHVDLNNGRSSHSMVAWNDRIFFIGGFSNSGECCSVQMLLADGVAPCPHQCMWGGPNLCALTPDGILKVTSSGVEIMNTSTCEWKQYQEDVPFTVGKGMKMQYIASAHKAYIFGCGEEFYAWDLGGKMFHILQNPQALGNMVSSTVKDKLLYALDDQRGVWVLDGEVWSKHADVHI